MYIRFSLILRDEKSDTTVDSAENICYLIQCFQCCISLATIRNDSDSLILTATEYTDHILSKNKYY